MTAVYREAGVPLPPTTHAAAADRADVAPRHRHRPAVGRRLHLGATLRPAVHGLRLGLDGGPRRPPPARRSTAASRLRPRGLAQPARGDRRDRRGADLGHPWLHRRAGPLAARARAAMRWRSRPATRASATTTRSPTAPSEAAGPAMRAFAQLYAALDETTATNEKIAALVDYFRTAPAADAAWAVHFLIGRRPKRLVAAGKLRAWAAAEAGVPDWLFEESYHAVGDLAETITLLLPDRRARSDLPLSLLGRGPAARPPRPGRRRPAARADPRLARARPARALRLEQADHRQLPGRRLGAAGGPRAGRK